MSVLCELPKDVRRRGGEVRCRTWSTELQPVSLILQREERGRTRRCATAAWCGRAPVSLVLLFLLGHFDVLVEDFQHALIELEVERLHTLRVLLDLDVEGQVGLEVAESI